MPKESAARIVSGRRRWFLAVAAAAILAAGIATYFVAAPGNHGPAQPWQPPADTAASDDGPAPSLSYASVPATAGTKTYTLQVADTSEKQALGLGKRPTIGGDGMVFPYAKPQRLCFWMKDMRFPIDMIWLDAGKRVTRLQAQVSPTTYPHVTYCQDNAQYVVELGSGVAARDGIKLGDTLGISL